MIVGLATTAMTWFPDLPWAFPGILVGLAVLFRLWEIVRDHIRFSAALRLVDSIEDRSKRDEACRELALKLVEPTKLTRQ